MKIAIGLSLSKNPEKAVEEAVKEALKTVPEPGLAVCFASIHLNQKRIHKALCDHLNPNIITGGSSYSEITNVGVTKRSVAVLLMSGKKLQTKFSVSKVFKNCRKTGLNLAKEMPSLNKKTRNLGLLFGSIKNGYEQLMVDGVTENLDAPVFGGLTCGNYDLGMSHPDFWANYQFCGSKLSTSNARLAVAEFPAESKFAFGYGHGWEPVGEELEITRAEGPEVFELNGQPIIEFYRQFLGQDSGDKFFELMVQRYGFSMAAPGIKKTRIKLPVACDFKRGCINYFPAENMKGKKVRLIQASRLTLVEGARSAAKECAAANRGKKPDLVFMVSCCSRSHILHSRENDEVDAVRSVFGKNVPIFGFYSGGEIVPFINKCSPTKGCGSLYHTTTVALMAFYLGGKVEVSVPKAKNVGSQKNQNTKKMLERSEEMLDITENFMANLSRKSYKDGESLRRHHDIIHAYTPHGVWKEVGVLASAGGQELKDAEFKGVFMFMDVKGFTTYSETHSSSEVVKGLNEIFNPATGIIYKNGGDVDKFIGDCIFASFTSSEKAALASKAILLLFRKLKAKGNPFSVRIGLNDGRAVRANVGAANRREYTFIGDAVNTAQRLEANCEPGKVLVSAGVYKKAGKVFKNAEEKFIKVKGKEKLLRTFLCRV